MRPPGGTEIPLEDLYAEVCRSGSSWTRRRVSVHVFMLSEAAESSVTTLSANLAQALFFFKRSDVVCAVYQTRVGE